MVKSPRIKLSNMIQRCAPEEFESIYEVINDAATVYKGVIPADCWKEPYMPRAELRDELEQGVVFWGAYESGTLVAVMGLQHVQKVALIRHAYTRTTHQRRGLGIALLEHLREQTKRPLLVGTWRAAAWAIRFYENHGFRVMSESQTRALLQKYWTVPDRQIEESVVLADAR